MMHRLLTVLLATEQLLHRARRRSSPVVTVLMYHEVLGDDDAEAWTAVRVSELRRQIEYLKSAVDILSLDEALTRNVKSRASGS